MKSTILIVSSNPQDTSFLRLDRELRIIREVIQRSELSDRINIQVEWAVRTIDLLYALQRYKPWIIHFCGHGEGQAGLAFEDETGQKTTISNAALTEVASQFAACTECILLNACYSKVQAALMSKHINYVIGMSNAIEDKAALAFTRGFYTALGGKEPISSAYRFGTSQIAIEYPENIANPLTQRKATVVDSSSLQATEPAPAAAKMPLLFQKEILTEFNRSWMTSPNQKKENPDYSPEKESGNADKQNASQSSQQPNQQQTNHVSGITFGAGNTTFNFAPVQTLTGNVNLSNGAQSSLSSPTDPASNKQSLQEAIIQLKQVIASDAEMNPMLKQGALSQVEQVISELQTTQPDSAKLEKMLSDLTQGFPGSSSITADIEKVTRLFHRIWST